MGIFDRFRPAGEPHGQTYDGQRVDPTEDEQALARYRYMLKTAPPDAIEQAHAEAFAKLTPEQRRRLLEQLRNESPEAERAYATDNPQALARLATRAEVRQPGTMERLFGGGGGGGAGMPGFGGMMAGSLLGSVAGTVLGTMIAQNFLGGHGTGHGDAGDAGHGQGLFGGQDADRPQGSDTLHDAGMDSGNHTSLDDLGPGFDTDSFDI